MRGGRPLSRICCAITGISSSTVGDTLTNTGIHAIVGTPGEDVSWNEPQVAIDAQGNAFVSSACTFVSGCASGPGDPPTLFGVTPNGHVAWSHDLYVSV